MSALLCAVLFLSGASALIFETLWFRQAGLAFGNSIWASSLVLSAFMGGLALGNAIAARFGARVSRPIRAYAVAEGVIALTGVAIVYLLPLLGGALAPVFRPLLDEPWFLNPLRLFVAFAVLLIPSTAMGITLPLLTTVLAARDVASHGRQHARADSRLPTPESRLAGTFGHTLGRLYGWNTLGAMVGVVAGEAYLVGAYGVRGTALIAGALNLAAAAAAALVSWKGKAHEKGGTAPSSISRLSSLSGSYLGAAFLSGFCLLALEVIWFRFLLLFVKGHSNAFPLMLGVVLAGIALGGLTASLWLRWSAGAYRFASPIAFAAATACVISYGAFPRVMAPLGLSTVTSVSAILQVGVPLMFPVSFVSGIFFTLTGAALRGGLSSEAETAGVLTLANTIGAAIGSLVAGFALLPALGIEKSLFLIAVVYGGIGCLVWRPAVTARAVKSRPPYFSYVAATVCVLSVALFPFGSLEARLLPIPIARWAETEPERRILAVREGLTETVVFFQRLLLGKPVSDVMLTNSFSMSTTGYGVRRYQKLYVYWPMAVHPEMKRALLIGYGVGNTAKAMTDSAGLESIDLVDLSRDILALSPIVFPSESDQPLRDPRLHVHIEDGRYFLQTTDRTFDLITGEPPPPGIAGVENLYSREYFQLIHDRLAQGGIVTYWLPLADLSDVSSKAILRAFCDVFDDCSLWNGSGTNLMMVGTRGARGPVSQEAFDRQWTIPTVAAEMKRLGFEQPEQLGALFIGDAEYLRNLVGDTRPLTDDDPKLIEAPFSSQTAGPTLLEGLADVAQARRRFQASPLIARLWPQSVAAASLPYFDFQSAINAHMYGNLITSAPAIEDVDRVLTHSTLTAPVLWRLGTNSDIQGVVSAATPADMTNPLMQFHLGINRLAERDYAAAAVAFARAESLRDVSDNAFVMHVYSLCMTGRASALGEAQALAHDAWLQASREGGAEAASASLPAFWVWMKERCGIDPRVEVETWKSGKVEQ